MSDPNTDRVNDTGTATAAEKRELNGAKTKNKKEVLLSTTVSFQKRNATQRDDDDDESTYPFGEQRATRVSVCLRVFFAPCTPCVSESPTKHE